MSWMILSPDLLLEDSSLALLFPEDYSLTIESMPSLSASSLTAESRDLIDWQKTRSRALVILYTVSKAASAARSCSVFACMVISRSSFA